MVKKPSSNQERLAKEDFKVEHYIALWQHYENRGGSDKNRMVTVVTWLLAFAAGILAFTATKFDFSTWSFKEKELAIVGSLIGLCICLLSTFLVYSFAGYAERNFHRADKIKDGFNELAQIADSGSKSMRGLVFRRLGVLFDVFFWCSGLGMLLFLCILILALIQ